MYSPRTQGICWCKPGHHTLLSYKLYWSNQPDLSVPLIPSTMSKTRFEQFLSNLHVNDDRATHPTNDKLWKMRPLISLLNENFSKLYDVKREQSIDESMILFNGRSSLKQYCPVKPIKRGFKMWVRADSDGYISKFEVYQGKGTGAGIEGFGLGESVVLNLCQDILGKGHKIFFDNFFTSLPLLAHLRSNDTWSCGTIRSNRKGLPNGLAAEKVMSRGQFDFRVSDDNICFFKWMDVFTWHPISTLQRVQLCRGHRKMALGQSLHALKPFMTIMYSWEE